MIDDGVSEFINDRDILGSPDDFQISQFELGTVGHDDAAVHYDTGSDDNDGNTLVRVTLFKGRDRSKPITPGIAQGHQVMCQISSSLSRIPPPGTRVVVAFPGGMEQVAGSGVILATLEKAPNQFSETRAKLDYGPDMDLLIKARSITLTDYSNRFIALGPQSDIMVQGADGSGIKVQAGVVGVIVAAGGAMKSALELTANAVNLGVNGGSLLKLEAQKATLFGISAYLQGATCYIGKAPTAATGALILAAGVPTPSLGVFISP